MEVTEQGVKELLLELCNPSARVTISKQDGFIKGFMLNETGVNPLSGPKGHFLCLDRWGPATDAEKANGMPWHGEASHVLWQSESNSSEGLTQRVVMTCRLPLAGMRVRRVVELLNNSAVIRVTEEVTNENTLGRIFNMVQHPTLAPPFLDKSTVVDSNATKGFIQDDLDPNPETKPIQWPNAQTSSDTNEIDEALDLRHLKTEANPQLASFIFPPDTPLGWVTACTPTKGLMIGYVWNTQEYRWLNIWRRAENGEALARGIEFGTTGLHRPFPELVAKGAIFETPLGEYIDAEQTIKKSYFAFLARIPTDFQGVADLTQNNSHLILQEAKPGQERSLKIEMGTTLPRP